LTAAPNPNVVSIKPSVGGWLQFPKTIAARSPLDRAQVCTFRVAETDLRKAVRAGRRQPIMEFWSVVVGSPPPIPGVDHRNRETLGDLASLKDAYACFRGIRRPVAEDDDGENVLAYVVHPSFFYEFDANMTSPALKVPVPRGLVFVVYVRLDGAYNSIPQGTIGTITHWGFVEADKTNVRLPINFGTRYQTRLW
jgi:hypothetical protein